VWLEFFRLDHGHEEVGEEAQGDQSHDEVFHGGFSLEISAEAHVESAEDEEGSGDAEIDKIVHDESRVALHTHLRFISADQLRHDPQELKMCKPTSLPHSKQRLHVAAAKPLDQQKPQAEEGAARDQSGHSVHRVRTGGRPAAHNWPTSL
jgi:hypothetical protein